MDANVAVLNSDWGRSRDRHPLGLGVARTSGCESQVSDREIRVRCASCMKRDTAMEPTVIRGEVQAFLHACHSFTVFALYKGLTHAEHAAIAHVARSRGSEFKPSKGDRPRSYLPVDD